MFLTASPLPKTSVSFSRLPSNPLTPKATAHVFLQKKVLLVRDAEDGNLLARWQIGASMVFESHMVEGKGRWE